MGCSLPLQDLYLLRQIADSKQSLPACPPCSRRRLCMDPADSLRTCELLLLVQVSEEVGHHAG